MRGVWDVHREVYTTSAGVEIPLCDVHDMPDSQRKRRLLKEYDEALERKRSEVEAMMHLIHVPSPSNYYH